MALQVIQDINEYLKANKKEELPESTQNTLKDQIAEMEDPNHRIRDLVQRRIIEFHKQAISTARSAPLQVIIDLFFRFKGVFDFTDLII